MNDPWWCARSSPYRLRHPLLNFSMRFSIFDLEIVAGDPILVRNHRIQRRIILESSIPGGIILKITISKRNHPGARRNHLGARRNHLEKILVSVPGNLRNSPKTNLNPVLSCATLFCVMLYPAKCQTCQRSSPELT